MVGARAVATVCLCLVGCVACSNTGDETRVGQTPGGEPEGGVGGAGLAGAQGVAGLMGGQGGGPNGGRDGTGTAGGFGARLDVGNTSTEICDGIGLRPEPVATDLYLLLDRSSSMADPISGSDTPKWEAVKAGIVMFAEDPYTVGIGIGLQYFALAEPCDVDAYAVPAVPIGLAPEPRDALQASLDAQTLEGETPTAPALEGALQHMSAWAAEHRDRTAVVAIITDYLPTECGVSCSADDDCVSGVCAQGVCESGPLFPEIQALTERYRGADPPVHTFAITIGEGLDVLPLRRTQSGTIWASDQLDQNVFVALTEIIDTPASCALDVPVTSDALPFDADRLNLSVTPTATVPRVAGASDCGPRGDEGWYYDDPDNPGRIMLCTATCAAFGPDAVLTYGCESQWAE